MTLDEFQKRLREACDAHIENVAASAEAFTRTCEALAAEAATEANPAYKAIAEVEIIRMQKALS